MIGTSRAATTTQRTNRFPPEPNGYLHIGHAKPFASTSDWPPSLAQVQLAFDDTNPSKEETEYVEAIMEDVQVARLPVGRSFYASDYFQQLYDGLFN